MNLYKRTTKILFLSLGLLVAMGLYLFIQAGARFPKFIPYVIAAIAVAPTLLAGSRKLSIEGGSLVIREYNRTKILPLSSVVDVVADDMEIVVKTSSGELVLCHSNFESAEQEADFLKRLKCE